MTPAHPCRGFGLNVFVTRVLMCLLVLGLAGLLGGCEEAAETYKNEMQSVVVAGTWRAQSMEGGTANERLALASGFDAELMLNSDDSFKFSGGFLGTSAVFRGTWRVEDGKVILQYSERDGKPHTANDETLEIVGEELLLRSNTGKTLVFAEVK